MTEFRPSNRCPNKISSLLACLCISCLHAVSQVASLPNAHAHNDYLHKHPLEDALKFGFTSIEADIFIFHDELIVAHTNPYFKKERTLENLYLRPLLKKIRASGSVYGDSKPVLLLIDIKGDPDESLVCLEKKLAPYMDILTRTENGKVVPGALTIILSGNKPAELKGKEMNSHLFLDESLMGLDLNRSCLLYPLASTKYSNISHWKGKGKFDEQEKERLLALVAEAHRQGKKVRLWASPENKIVWAMLLECGVDLINTDKLEELSKFLKK
jgi:hypothetical protein